MCSGVGGLKGQNVPILGGRKRQLADLRFLFLKYEEERRHNGLLQLQITIIFQPGSPFAG